MQRKRLKFWSHTKQHSSKTKGSSNMKIAPFWSHTKQHSSKTCFLALLKMFWFWSHTKQHSSKTHIFADEHLGIVLESYKTT